jgi:cytochrome c-type biogenesis protein
MPMSSLPLPVAAFLAGLISFLSPCVLPLVPGYVSLISGAGIDELKSSQSGLKRRVMVNSIAFILGFSVVFIALGAAATEVGQALGYYRSFLAREAGVLIILFGLHMTGLVTIKALYSDVRLHNVKGDSTIWGSFAVGFAFAFGWTPCVGPILSVILGFASAQSSLFKGILLLATYSLGLAVPFLLTSLGIGEFLKFYSRFKRHMHVVEVGSGVLLIGLGELLVFDRFTVISNWLSSLGRFEVWLEGLVTRSAWVGVVIVAVLVLLGLYAAFRRRGPATAAQLASPAQAEIAGPVHAELAGRSESAAADQLEPASVAQAEQAPVVAKTRNPLALVVVAVVAAGMLYFGFHAARRTDSGPQKPLGYATPAPDFTLESLDGQNVTLSNLRGKAVLLNFWATWCTPCKIEMPWFVELQRQYGPQGLQIVGVAMDDADKGDIAEFAKKMGVNYPVLLGKEAVGDAYGGVPALPESFFIGRDGKIVDRIIGLKDRGDIEESIKKALDTRSVQSARASTANAATVQK